MSSFANNKTQPKLSANNKITTKIQQDGVVGENWVSLRI